MLSTRSVSVATRAILPQGARGATGTTSISTRAGAWLWRPAGARGGSDGGLGPVSSQAATSGVRPGWKVVISSVGAYFHSGIARLAGAAEGTPIVSRTTAPHRPQRRL